MKTIVELQAIIEKASVRATVILRKRITPEQALVILASESGYEIDQLIAKEWSEEEIVAALRDCKSVKELPDIEAIIRFDESIIPDGTEQALLEQEIKHKGEIWFVHRHDADPHPSNPHAHNYESNLKLHLGNGDLYRGRRKAGSISKKKLLAIREKVKNLDLPHLDV